ncbi:MAG: hypothetical protein DMENIID0002_09310 [Rickettsia endosymbiont of Sergentomyia squamirostris]|uniref:Leucine Rich repeat family protein n=1 Tax=Candidatus Tisiphia endosymbiont of Sergentomyia squamirostris TaxID=3113639 RepID=A0AAT9G907_9RICK
MTEFILYVKDNSFLDLHNRAELLNDNNNLQALSLFIKSNPNIVKLNLAGCNIDSDKIKLLIDSINDSNITDLNIGNNKLGHEGAAEIAKLTKLINLGITYNGIGDVGTDELANKLLNLTYLNICKSDLTSEGAAKIANKLLNLTNLDISCNNIGDDGAAEIAKLPCLTKLRIARNNLSYTGIEELANLINCVIDTGNQEKEIFLSLLTEAKKNNLNGNLTSEDAKNILFKIALQNDTCNVIKHIINHPEKYPLAINLRNEQGLLHFYNYSMKMKDFVSQNAIVPEQEQQKKTLLRLVQDNSYDTNSANYSH